MTWRNEFAEQAVIIEHFLDALGALLGHITGGADATTYQPMNINFGLFPDLDARDPKGRPIRGRDRKKAVAERARADLDAWLGEKLAAE